MDRRALAVTLALLVSCSSPSSTPGGRGGPGPTMEAVGRTPASGAEATSAAGGAAPLPASPASSPTDRAADGGRTPSSASGRAVPAPLPGRYVFTQGGYEELCRAGACSRRRLPPRQEAVVSTVLRRARRTDLTTEVRSTDDAVTTTSTTHTAAGIDITEVRIDFAALGYTQSITPEPAIRSVVWPLEAGTTWGGAWEGSVHGSYRINVLEEGTISIGDRAVDAVLIRTQIDFGGDFEGESQIDAWLDSRTGAILRTAGRMVAATGFGDYRTRFVTELEEGPGYRRHGS